MAKALTHCPGCGERVTPYAAGCAICGADLGEARRELARRQEARPSLPALPGASRLPEGFGIDALIGVLLLLFALFSPFFGLIIAALAAWKAHQDWKPLRRNFALAAMAVAAVLLIVLAVAPGEYGRLLFLFSS